MVGSDATVRAYEDKHFKGTEFNLLLCQSVKNLGKLAVANNIESLKIIRGK